MKHDCQLGQHTSKISDKIAALRAKKNARHEAFVCHACSVWKCSVSRMAQQAKSFPSKISDKIAALRAKKNARHEAFVCHACSVWKCSVLPNGATSISGAARKILSNSIVTSSRARPSTSTVVACAISYFFSHAGQSS